MTGKERGSACSILALYESAAAGVCVCVCRVKLDFLFLFCFCLLRRKQRFLHTGWYLTTLHYNFKTASFHVHFYSQTERQIDRISCRKIEHQVFVQTNIFLTCPHLHATLTFAHQRCSYVGKKKKTFGVVLILYFAVKWNPLLFIDVMRTFLQILVQTLTMNYLTHHHRSSPVQLSNKSERQKERRVMKTAKCYLLLRSGDM